MTSKWHKTKFVDLAALQRGYDLPKTAMKSGPFPVIGSSGVIGFHDQKSIDGPCLTIGRSGSIGRPRYCDGPAWIHNTALYVKDFRGNDPLFVYYYFLTIPFEKVSGGSAVPTLNRNHLADFDVTIPDLPLQKKIALFLSRLDQKIEVNNRINGCLLEQVLSKYDALFDDDDSLETLTISSIGTVVGGGTPSKSKPEFYCEHGIPWVTPKDLSLDHSVFIERGNEDISELGLAKSGANIMPANTVLFSSRAPIGYTAISLGPISTNQGFKSVIPNPEIGPYFVYCFLRKNLETIEGMASGSTFKEVSGSIMKRVPVNVPNAHRLRLFNEFAAPAFNTIKNNEAEIKRLTILRDSLLPKLMSGEIDVDSVEIG